MLRIDFTEKTHNTTVKSYLDMENDVIKCKHCLLFSALLLSVKVRCPAVGCLQAAGAPFTAVFLLSSLALFRGLCRSGKALEKSLVSVPLCSL